MNSEKSLKFKKKSTLWPEEKEEKIFSGDPDGGVSEGVSKLLKEITLRSGYRAITISLTNPAPGQGKWAFKNS